GDADGGTHCDVAGLRADTMVPIATRWTTTASTARGMTTEINVEVARFTKLHPNHASHRYCNLSHFNPSQSQAISNPPPQQKPTHTDAPNHYIGHNIFKKDKNKIVQVIKWMMSKGQGNTMETYGQLIRALDMDHRVEEAHKFWQTKIATNLHSVPWQLCHLMIAVYYRNKMLDDLVQ
ncbi:hypothetical protein S83_050474, partial [Arachis hypogaea]